MKFENTEVFNFEGALRGMRNPMESWDKSDSVFCSDLKCSASKCRLLVNSKCLKSKLTDFVIGENDLKLAQTLIKAGCEHRKFMRQIFVSVDITAPLYWWKEFDTYKVGTVFNSTSTMHKLADTPITKECFEMDDFLGNFENSILPYSFFNDYWDEIISQLERLRKIYLETKDKRYWKELIRLLPESWLQKRTVTMNYENVLNMYRQRKNHKLTEWSNSFINWVETLPYFKEFFMGE